MLSCVVAAVLLAALPAMAAAEADCDALRGDEAILPGELLPDGGWSPVRLPDRGDVADSLARLDVDRDPLVHRIDLNGDGKAELLLASPDSRLCGNAGCPYHLLAPDSYRRIGEFFGHMVVLDERINRYRLIQTYSRHRTSATAVDTFAFDRGKYRLVAHLIVDSCGLEQWEKRMRRIAQPGVK